MEKTMTKTIKLTEKKNKGKWTINKYTWTKKQYINKIREIAQRLISAWNKKIYKIDEII